MPFGEEDEIVQPVFGADDEPATAVLDRPPKLQTPEEAEAEAKETLRLAEEWEVSLDDIETNYDVLKDFPVVDHAASGMGTGPGRPYPLAKTLFVRPYLAAINAAIPGARRKLLSLTDAKMGVQEFTGPGGLAEQIEKAPWYKKLPELGGWVAEKGMEYKALSGLFRATGLSKVFGAIGTKLANKVAGKQLATIGGKQALLKYGGWNTFRVRVLSSVARTAPENMAFLATWHTTEAARRGEDVGPAAAKGALWGLGFSVAIPLVTEGLKAGMSTRTFEKAAIKLQTKYPRLADYLAGRPEQEFIDATLQSLKEEAIAAGEAVPGGVTFSNLPKESQNIIKALARRYKAAWQKAIGQKAAAQKYWAAGAEKAVEAPAVADKARGVIAKRQANIAELQKQMNKLEVTPPAETKQFIRKERQRLEAQQAEEIAEMDRELAAIQRRAVAEGVEKKVEGIETLEKRAEAPAEVSAEEKAETAKKWKNQKTISFRANVAASRAIGRYKGQKVAGKPEPVKSLDEIQRLVDKAVEEHERLVDLEPGMVKEGFQTGDTILHSADGLETTRRKMRGLPLKIPTTPKGYTTPFIKPPAGPVVKEPWEMTGKELTELKQKGDLTEDFGIEPWQVKTSAAIEATKIIGGNVETARLGQERIIKKAVSEGKPVPREVLEEYKSEKWAQEAIPGAQVEKGKRVVEPPKPLPSKEQATKIFAGVDPGFDKFVAKDIRRASAKEQSKKTGEYLKEVAKAVPRLFMRLIEPSKAVESQFPEAYASIIRGIHKPEAKQIEFNAERIDNIDMNLEELRKWFNEFSNDDLENLMASRGTPGSVAAEMIQKKAIESLPEELKQPGVIEAIERVTDYNYKYLKYVVGDNVGWVKDYFYGIYKNPDLVDRFIKHWKTTKRFTKHKHLPTVSDALDYGLELRSNNPVENLRAEYMGIARLEAMKWLKDELLRTGKGVYIDNMMEAPPDWQSVKEPVFADVMLKPEVAHLINNLISTNKITRQPFLNFVRGMNNVLRAVKFIGSAFHLKVIAKQAVADSGYVGFIDKTATRGITKGFKEDDPIFQTPEYKDYIQLGGGHRYSIESQAQKALHDFIDKLSKGTYLGPVTKIAWAPIKLPTGFVDWMFEKYIPKVKYAKYLDVIARQEKKLGRELTDHEKINIIKEGQNFYGEMNERLFGRSGTTTTALRFFFMAPGFAEGNYRTILKSLLQWGFKEGPRAGRSRANIVNSAIVTSILATIGTLIFTGKLPKKPESTEDIRDLFKIDTGKPDDRGRRIMIDMMDYDKDYFNVYYNLLRGRPDTAVSESLRRLGGMKAPLFEMMLDMGKMAMGEALYDWKGDRVTEITDTWLQKLMKIAVHEIKKTEPISVSVYKQARRKEVDAIISFVEAISGVRPTISEKDKRERDILRRIWSLKGQQEELYQYLRTAHKPREAVAFYNRKVNEILDSKLVPEEMRKEWGPELLIDLDRLLKNKQKTYISPAHTVREAERLREFLINFDLEPKGVWEGPKELKEALSEFTKKRRELMRAKDKEKLSYEQRRELKKYERIESSIAKIAKRIAETDDRGKQQGYFERIKSLLERANQ